MRLPLPSTTTTAATCTVQPAVIAPLRLPPRFPNSTPLTCFPLLPSTATTTAREHRLCFSTPAARKKAQGNAVETDFVLGEEENDSVGGVGDAVDEECEEEELKYSREFRGEGDEKDHDRDPELAELLGNFFVDPQNAQTRVEERIRKKKDRVLQTKTGSAKPMKVVFNKFNVSNSYIWFEFYNAPLPNDVSLICNTIRSWHIIGRLGGCNSMNMQLSQAPLVNKRPSYDAIAGANVTPTTFYNIGDLEIQDNLARIWVDIGMAEPLLLDILINALVNINSDYVGIKQLAFGGNEFQDWKENLTSEDAGFSVHRI